MASADARAWIGVLGIVMLLWNPRRFGCEAQLQDQCTIALKTAGVCATGVQAAENTCQTPLNDVFRHCSAGNPYRLAHQNSQVTRVAGQCGKERQLIAELLRGQMRATASEERFEAGTEIKAKRLHADVGPTSSYDSVEISSARMHRLLAPGPRRRLGSVEDSPQGWF